MGFWKEIKHALNGTLGTKEFRSLDKIIEGRKIFLATTDFVIAQLPSLGELEKSKTYTIGAFKTKVSGAVYFKCSLIERSNYASYISINVTDEEGAVQTISINTPANASNTVTNFSNILNLKANHTYTITANWYEGGGALGVSMINISLCGIVVEGNPIELLE